MAATIKDRFSKTTRGNYLSSGCQHSHAIRGAWPLARVISEYELAANARVATLTVSAKKLFSLVRNKVIEDHPGLDRIGMFTTETPRSCFQHGLKLMGGLGVMPLV